MSECYHRRHEKASSKNLFLQTNCLLSGELFPLAHDEVAAQRVGFKRPAAPPGLFAGNQRAAQPGKRVEREAVDVP